MEKVRVPAVIPGNAPQHDPINRHASVRLHRNGRRPVPVLIRLTHRLFLKRTLLHPLKESLQKPSFLQLLQLPYLPRSSENGCNFAHILIQAVCAHPSGPAKILLQPLQLLTVDPFMGYICLHNKKPPSSLIFQRANCPLTIALS